MCRMRSEHDPWQVHVVRHVGDSDVERLTRKAMSHADALELIRAAADDNPGEEFELDLVYAESGRFASWSL